MAAPASWRIRDVVSVVIAPVVVVCGGGVVVSVAQCTAHLLVHNW